MTGVYEPIIHGGLVEAWAEAHLKEWLPAYLCEIARQVGIDPPPPSPKGYITTPEFDKWPEDQTPVLMIVSPGTIGDPLEEGSGAVRATWSLGVAAVVSANTERNTHTLARLYAAAVRASILQHPSLGRSEVRGTDWINERYDDLPAEDTRRSLGAGQVMFTVEVANVLSTAAGPVTPPDDCPDVQEWTTIDDVIININKEEVITP